MLDAAIGGLTLMAPDPNRRYDAAQAVFKSRAASVLPALDKALAAETNPRVKKAMTEARAAIVVTAADSSPADKIAAIAVIRDRGDQDALGLIDGLPADQPADVRKAAQAASAKIQSKLAIWNTVQNAWYGLSLGSVLLLAAIGLAITFGVMGVINMAHGEMVMLGAYTTFVVQELIRTHNPALFDYSLAIARAARLPGVGQRRRHRRAHHHPFPVRPAAGNPARHLGPVAGAAAGGAHHLRADQQGRRQSVLDERGLRSRRHHHHL